MNTKSNISIFCITDFWFPKIGGMERSIDNLCSTIPESFDVNVITKQDDLKNGFNFPYKVIKLHANNNDGYYQNALKIISSTLTPKIVHIFGFSFFWPEAQANFIEKISLLPNASIIIKVPTSGDASKYLLHTHKKIIDKINCYIALTDAISNELKKCGVKESQIEKIPNGVRSNFYQSSLIKEKITARKKYHIKTNCLLMGFCGRFEHRKRIDVIINAVKGLYKENDIYLLLAGDTDNTFNNGIDIQKLKGENIIFLKEQKDIRPFYSAIDIYISSSEAEGMSNSILEAMSCGLPIIASNIPGHKELIKPKKNGLLFKPGNILDAQKCIIKALSQWKKNELNNRGAESRKIIIERYDQFLITKKYAKIYNKIIFQKIN